MGRLEPKHWALLGAGVLAALSTAIGGIHAWRELLNPPVIAGLLGQIGVIIGSIFVGAPQNPNLNPLVNPGRRADDPVVSAPLGSVSDATRRNLP